MRTNLLCITQLEGSR